MFTLMFCYNWFICLEVRVLFSLYVCCKLVVVYIVFMSLSSFCIVFVGFILRFHLFLFFPHFLIIGRMNYDYVISRGPQYTSFDLWVGPSISTDNVYFLLLNTFCIYHVYMIIMYYYCVVKYCILFSHCWFLYSVGNEKNKLETWNLN